MAQSARFSGRRVAVTGAGGFIGRALCRTLVAEGAEVVGLELDPARRNVVTESGASFAACDVRDAAALRRALDGIDGVFHTAAHIHEGERMDDFVDLNVRGTVNVCEAAASAGAGRVVHLSSVVVYGYDDPSTQDEDAPLRTVGIPYLDTKSSSDRIARRRGAVVIRAGDVIGPGSVPWTLRPLELARQGRLAVPAPGDGRMLPVYVGDLAEAALRGVLAGEQGRAYTAWSGEEISFGAYFDRLAALVGGRCRRVPMKLLRAAARLAPLLPAEGPELGAAALTFVSRRGSVSAQRVREELGWEAQTSVAEALELVRKTLQAESREDRSSANRASAGAAA